MSLKEVSFAVPKAAEGKPKAKVADSHIVSQNVDSEAPENAFKVSRENARSLSEASPEDDSDYKDLLTEEMLVRVCENYWRVRKEYDAMVQAEGQYQVRGGGRPMPLCLPKLELDPSKDAYGTLTNARGRIIDRAPLFALPAVKSTPPMQYWTLTEANINTEDEPALSHFPYTDDIPDEEEAEIRKDLKAAYPDGIHGTEEGLGAFINDWLCYYTVKNVLAESKLDARDSEELRWVMRHVRELFPNKASVDSLVATYPDLQQRFEPETIRKVPMMNEKGELVANFAPHKLMGTFKALLCRVCFVYACQRHTQPTLTANAAPCAHEEHDGVAEEVDQEPCGNNCYRVKGPLPATRRANFAKMTKSPKKDPTPKRSSTTSATRKSLPDREGRAPVFTK